MDLNPQRQHLQSECPSKHEAGDECHLQISVLQVEFMVAAAAGFAGGEGEGALGPAPTPDMLPHTGEGATHAPPGLCTPGPPSPCRPAQHCPPKQHCPT